MNAVDKKDVEKTDVERTVDKPHYTPKVEIFETSEGLTLVAEMPGVPKENINVSVDDGVLTLRGENRLGLPDGARAVYREFDEGVFYRAFTLPENLDTENIVASYEDGVLSLAIPKAERAKPRFIEVK